MLHRQPTRLPALLCSLAALLAGCSAESAGTSVEVGEHPSQVSTPIVGGTHDTGDPAAVMIFAIPKSGANYWAVCSGTVVSPHVVATAAHCLAPSKIAAALGTTDYEIRLFLGDDDYDPAQNTAAFYAYVESAHMHPGYDVQQTPSPHDVGAVVTTTPFSITPMPINRTALGQEWVGKQARIIGFGRTIASSNTSMAVKMQGTVTIDGVEPELLSFKGTPGTCGGDSGGPLLITRNGVESLAGIHSYMDSAQCNGTAYERRADADLVGFIEAIVQDNDPGFVLPGDGSSGGSGGSTGSAGQGGAAGSGGSAGHAGTGGAAGSAGTGGTGGNAGYAGEPGQGGASGLGGEAGNGGPGVGGTAQGGSADYPAATADSESGCSMGRSSGGTFDWLLVAGLVLARVATRRRKPNR